MMQMKGGTKMRLKRCAICGSEPELTSNDMGTGNGHGYPGYTNYQLKCPDCGMIRVSADNIYDDSKDGRKPAPERVQEEWNKAVDKLESYMVWRTEIEKINPFVKDLLLAFVEGKEEIHLTEYLRAKLLKEIENL